MWFFLSTSSLTDSLCRLCSSCFHSMLILASFVNSMENQCCGCDVWKPWAHKFSYTCIIWKHPILTCMVGWTFEEHPFFHYISHIKCLYIIFKLVQFHNSYFGMVCCFMTKSCTVFCTATMLSLSRGFLVDVPFLVSHIRHENASNLFLKLFLNIDLLGDLVSHATFLSFKNSTTF